MKLHEHVLLGTMLTFTIWAIAPQLSPVYLLLIFFPSFLINFDHYVKPTKKRKKDFHLFHTVEFLLAIGVLSLFLSLFFYLFVGLVFHMILDLLTLLQTNSLHKKEYFLFNWIRNKI